MIVGGGLGVRMPAPGPGADGGPGVSPLDPVRSAYDPALLQAMTHIAVERLTGHLSQTRIAGVDLPRPADLVAEADALMRSDAPLAERFGRYVDLHLRTAIQLPSTGALARQFTTVLPVAGAVDLVSAIAPQPASGLEASPSFSGERTI